MNVSTLRFCWALKRPPSIPKEHFMSVEHTINNHYSHFIQPPGFSLERAVGFKIEGAFIWGEKLLTILTPHFLVQMVFWFHGQAA